MFKGNHMKQRSHFLSMSRLVFFLTGIFFLSLLGCSKAEAIGSGSSAATISGNIATVNGVGISQVYFYNALQIFRLPANGRNPYPNESVGTTILRRLIQNQIVEQLAKKEGVYPSDADIQNLYKEVVYLQDKKSVKPFEKQLSELGLTPAYFQHDQILPHLCQINLAAKGLKITDQELSSYYSEHLADEFTIHNAAHIQRMVLSTKADADKISNAIKAGKSFDEMYSKSDSKDPDFGDIPQWIALDDKNPQFLPVITALNATPAGSVTAPISFQGGYWIIKVVQKRPAEIIPQDKVPATLREGLMQEKSGADSARLTAFESELNAAQRNADIKVMNPQYNDLVTELKNPPDLSKIAAPSSH